MKLSESVVGVVMDKGEPTHTLSPHGGGCGGGWPARGGGGIGRQLCDARLAAVVVLEGEQRTQHLEGSPWALRLAASTQRLSHSVATRPRKRSGWFLSTFRGAAGRSAAEPQRANCGVPNVAFWRVAAKSS